MLNLMNSRKTTALSIGICVASITLRATIPTRALSLGLHDDDWMVSNAYWLVNGEFRRPWTILSMNKELGYPFFLAIARTLQTSPILLAHFIFVFVSWLLVRAMRQQMSTSINLLMLTALVLNPAIFGLTASRIYRDMWTIVLTLSLLILVLNIVNKARGNLRINKLVMVCTLGFILSLWLRMTRVDTYWVLIVIFVPSIPTIFELISRTINHRRIELKAVHLGTALLLASISLGQLIAPHVSSEINSRRYGVNLPDDFFVGEFSSLFKTWSAIKATSEVAYTPINQEQRLVAYGQSPLLQRLEPQIEGDFSSGWRSISCQATGVCDDIAGGYFAHAVRDAYAYAYPNSNGMQFQEFMKNANLELRMGCNKGEIPCEEAGLNTQLPSLNEIDWLPTFRTAISFVFNRSLRFNDSIGFEPVGPSDGPHARAWDDFLLSGYGMKHVNQDGTPSWLRSPTKAVFDLLGWICMASVSIGLISVLILFIPQKRRSIAWLGVGCLAGVGVHAFVIAIAAQNSMGPLSFNGVWELTYLLQEIPFLIIGGVIGLELLFNTIRNLPARLNPESRNAGVE